VTQAPPIATAPPKTAAPPAIECSGVWKQYYFYAHRPRRLKEVFTGGAGPRPRITAGNTSEPVWALRDFQLSVYPGQTVGVVGNNGAGKSTLLKLLSRILQPTRGQLRVRGRTAAIIELGAGFHEELTAKENVYLAGSFLGLRKRQINELYPQIVEFAELGPHMDMPVKYFSSGMHARLGFSIAVSVNPDVLLIDEVLAVGDVGFQAKCKDRIAQFQQGGKAILFVSHDLATVKSLCQRVLWLKEGVTMADGDPVPTINAYLEHYWPGCTKG
jgi:ABC-type polysaccharide/polyol phosphate transport system ATPase subunit